MGEGPERGRVKIGECLKVCSTEEPLLVCDVRVPSIADVRVPSIAEE